jgi:hypothetical protein
MCCHCNCPCCWVLYCPSHRWPDKPKCKFKQVFVPIKYLACSSDLIASTLIVHNWLIVLGDNNEIVQTEEWMRIGVKYQNQTVAVGEEAKRKHVIIKGLLATIYLE